ncbi:alpha/beta hydrolase [Streptomyces sp. NPDC006551]|uniref:alpha/beta hydrolase n=1 Tax=Streptomyces sp. NPDC006551 TaxID=3157178 RepID=UPI0033B07C45
MTDTSPIGPPPPFDSELVPALASLARVMPPAIHPEMLPALRDFMESSAASDDDIRRGGAVEFEELRVPGPAGAPDISLLVCRRAGSTEPRPAVYFTHGGGMVLGNNRSLIGEMVDWVEQLGIVLVSVEYRLAPEHPFPAGLEDVYAGFRWTMTHAEDLGIDPERVVVSGPSAGGGLTAAVTLLARDLNGPVAAGQLLVCPMLDDRNDSASALQMAGVGAWDRTSNEMGWTALLGERRGGPDVPAHAAPARAEDLSGLPPLFVDVGSAETFRDEVVTYAARFWRAGSVAELHVWPGGFHGFDALAPDADVSKRARATRVDWLRRTLRL